MSWIVSPEVTEEDLPQVLKIERESFGSPWTEVMFSDVVSGASGTLGCAARSAKDHVIGFGICQVIVDEVSIHRVAVAREYQRHGVGFELLSSMLTLATCQGAKVASLEVRESNLAARQLYESKGFVCVARRSAYYKTPVDSALIYVLRGLD
jgi:ribosomal-protein-alanine N-acetyltransferase